MKRRKVTKKWTMRDGTKIRICDMSDKHLKNAMRLLERTESFINFMSDDGPFHDLPYSDLYYALLDEHQRREAIKNGDA